MMLKSLIISCCILFIALAGSNYNKAVNADSSSAHESGPTEDDREQVVKSLHGLKEMKRRFEKMLEEGSQNAEKVELQGRIANLDRMIEKTLMQLDEWDSKLSDPAKE